MHRHIPPRVPLLALMLVLMFFFNCPTAGTLYLFYPLLARFRAFKFHRSIAYTLSPFDRIYTLRTSLRRNAPPLLHPASTCAVLCRRARCTPCQVLSVERPIPPDTWSSAVLRFRLCVSFCFLLQLCVFLCSRTRPFACTLTSLSLHCSARSADELQLQ